MKVRRPLQLAVGGVALLRLSALVASDFSLPAQRERSTDWAEAWAETRRLSLTLELPPGSSLVRAPADVSLVSPWARWRLSWRAQGGRLVVERELVLIRRTVPLAEYEALADFGDQLRLAEAEAAVVQLPRPRR